MSIPLFARPLTLIAPSANGKISTPRPSLGRICVMTVLLRAIIVIAVILSHRLLLRVPIPNTINLHLMPIDNHRTVITPNTIRDERSNKCLALANRESIRRRLRVGTG